MSLIHQILTQYWGYTKFRSPQEEIIRSVMEGKDTLALLPTGGGKSLCFQVPAMAKEGLCLVVSPLIALMKDQVEQLQQKGIRATALLSGMKPREIEVALDNCQHGNYKFLYVSPERLESKQFRERLPYLNLNLIAIDEAHCISQWGFDFRPPYRRIAALRQQFPDIPVIALTASAPPEVQDDICLQLQFRDASVFKKSFARSNISYLVRYGDDKNIHLLRVLKTVPGTSIVYVRNRKKTQEIALFLQKNGLQADFYHAGIPQQQRSSKQEAWMKGQIRVIVSTNAFGMGINKPDVRTVIHMDLPDDLESYYQEAGRAGRDEKPAYALVLYNEADLLALDRRMGQGFPEPEQVKRIYDQICNYLQLPIGGGEEMTFPFDLIEFCHHFRQEPMQVFSCLKILELENYLSFTESIYLPARLFIPINQMELYRFQVQHERYDHLIKTILRSYSGLFEHYARFSEPELARRAGMELNQVLKDLAFLQQNGIFHYQPASETPMLSFITPRVENKHLRISKENLEDRKERFIARAKAFRHFITEKHQCRSMLILSYFGESELMRCGSCDYCRQRNKVNLNDLEMQSLQAEIARVLEQEPLLPDALIKQLPHVNRDSISRLVLWMLDNEELAYDLLGRLYLKRT